MAAALQSDAFVPFAAGPVSVLALTEDATLLAAVSDHAATVHVLPAPTPPSSASPCAVTITPSRAQSRAPPRAAAGLHVAASRLVSAGDATTVTAISFPHADSLYVADARGALSRHAVRTSASGAGGVVVDAVAHSFTIPAAHSAAELTAVAALSPAGRFASAAKDGLIRLWDVETRQTVLKLTGHRYDVRALSVAATLPSAPSAAAPSVADDVSVVASAGRDRTVRLWDARLPPAGGNIHVFTGHTGWVHDVALMGGHSPVVVSCSGDRTVRVWDLRTLTQRVAYDSHQYRIWSVDACAGTASSRPFAVSGSTDATVRVWPLDAPKDADVVSGQIDVLEAHRDTVLTVVASKNGDMVLSGCEDGTVLAWRPRVGDGGGSALLDGDSVFADGGAVEGREAAIEQGRDDINVAVGELIDMSGDDVEANRTVADVPKSLDATPLVAEASSTTTPSPFLGTGAAGVSATATAEKLKHGGGTADASTIYNGPDSDPRYDKAAAELVGALQRIRELEGAVKVADAQAAERDAVIASLRVEGVKREEEVERLRRLVEASRRTAEAVRVGAILRKEGGRMDATGIDFLEPVTKIGAVSDQLSKLAAKLDAMIATG